MSKPVILTGIRANNDLHIGNYFGALLPIVDMAKKRAGDYQINLFVPDLHSFITPVDHTTLFRNTMHNLDIFVAAGLPLDHPDIHIYRQSYIPAHSELAWILDCFTGFGEMSRMTQFKDKSSKLSEDHINVGIFNYPVLMAGDILLYGASYVPVGEDQTQHLEFTRDIAMRMNERFGNLFVVPKPVKEEHEFFGKDQGLRIKDLIDPTKKMSKSDDSARGIIFLGDDPDTAAKKIMGATTDSIGSIHFDRDKQPGVSNLLQILALLQGRELEDAVHEYEGKTSYGELKSALAEEIRNFLHSFQERIANVDEAMLTAKLETSEAAMREVADKTLLKVQRAVGLRPPIAASQDELIVDYRQELSKLGIENDIAEHPATRSAAEVVKNLGLTIADSLPTLIMKGDDKFVAAIIRGDTKVSIDKVKTLLGLNELRMATPDELTDFTRVPVGTARVYNPGAETVIDSKVFEKEHLMGGSGRFDVSIRYTTADLRKIPGSKVADITETETAKSKAFETPQADSAGKKVPEVKPDTDSNSAASILESEDIKAYEELLRNLDIDFKIVEHPELKTPTDTQAYLGLTMADGLSTMIMKVSGSYIAVLRRDDCRLDFSKLKHIVGKDVRMASPEEFHEVTGLQPGTARVYNPGMKTYLDSKLFEKEYLTGGSGSFLCSFRYRAEDLKKIPGAEIVDVLQ